MRKYPTLSSLTLSLTLVNLPNSRKNLESISLQQESNKIITSLPKRDQKSSGKCLEQEAHRSFSYRKRKASETTKARQGTRTRQDRNRGSAVSRGSVGDW